MARKDKKARFTALLHHIDVPLLTQSFYSLKSEAAPGSDGVTWQQYEADVYNRLEDLHRVQSPPSLENRRESGLSGTRG